MNQEEGQRTASSRDFKERTIWARGVGVFLFLWWEEKWEKFSERKQKKRGGGRTIEFT